MIAPRIWAHWASAAVWLTRSQQSNTDQQMSFRKPPVVEQPEGKDSPLQLLERHSAAPLHHETERRHRLSPLETLLARPFIRPDSWAGSSLYGEYKLNASNHIPMK